MLRIKYKKEKRFNVFKFTSNLSLSLFLSLSLYFNPLLYLVNVFINFLIWVQALFDWLFSSFPGNLIAVN